MLEINKAAVQDCLETSTYIVDANDEGKNLALESSGMEAVVLTLKRKDIRKEWAVRFLLSLLRKSEEDSNGETSFTLKVMT